MKYVKETKITIFLFGLIGASLMVFASYKESELEKQQNMEQVAKSCKKESISSNCSKVL